jgi:hypothetical protein
MYIHLEYRVDLRLRELFSGFECLFQGGRVTLETTGAIGLLGTAQTRSIRT